jgi:hypothetical protein
MKTKRPAKATQKHPKQALHSPNGSPSSVEEFDDAKMTYAKEWLKFYQSESLEILRFLNLQTTYQRQTKTTLHAALLHKAGRNPFSLYPMAQSYYYS